jgi:hypothetical protein
VKRFTLRGKYCRCVGPSQFGALYSDSVLNRLAIGDTAIVPVPRFYEASAVLSRAQNTGMLAASKAAKFITELKSLSIIADDGVVAHVRH